ncbi:MAG: hypothetical protein ACON4N_09290 [Myxococcota bacterium]
MNPLHWWTVGQSSDHRGALLHRPATDELWTTPWGPAFRHGGMLWLPVGPEQVASFPASRRIQVVQEGQRLVCWDPREGLRAIVSWSEVPPTLTWFGDDAGRHGPNLTLVRRRGHVACWQPLMGDCPPGARFTSSTVPIPNADGVVWADTPWVYRSVSASKLPRAVGVMASDEHVEVGPHGAVLVFDQLGSPTRAAAPGFSFVDLPEGLGDHLRWSNDGTVLAIIADDSAIWLDLTTGSIIEQREGHVPIGATPNQSFEARTGMLFGPEGPFWAGLMATPPCASGHLLAGPGATLYDLRAQRHVRREASLGDGPCVRVGELWLTLDAETGAAGWLNDRVEPVAELGPWLPAEDRIIDGWSHKASAVVVTERGAFYTIKMKGRAFKPCDDVPARPSRGRLAPQWRRLGLTFGTTHERQAWAWSRQGLVVRLPRS